MSAESMISFFGHRLVLRNNVTTVFRHEKKNLITGLLGIRQN